jgi:L-alanine-DL-glutamate epimerase-like enolase superfamily enzyme
VKITKLTTYPVPPRWLFLKIETDEGITGWGEPDLEGRMAKVLLRELEPLKLMFIEEPVRTEELDAFLPQLAAASTPVALGERLYSRWDFKAISVAEW